MFYMTKNPYLIAHSYIINKEYDIDSFDRAYDRGISVAGHQFGKDFSYACCKTVVESMKNHSSPTSILRQNLSSFKKAISGLDDISFTFCIETLKAMICDQFPHFMENHQLSKNLRTMITHQFTTPGTRFKRVQDILVLNDDNNDFYTSKKYDLNSNHEIRNWCKKHLQGIHKIHIDNDLDISVTGNVMITHRMSRLPVKFKNVDGNFTISNVGLRTLEGCPQSVSKSFNCSMNHLTSLQHGPDYVGNGYDCSHNLLENLEHCPKISMGIFNARYNPLKTLENFIHKNIDTLVLASCKEEKISEIAQFYDENYQCILINKQISTILFQIALEKQLNAHEESTKRLKI